MSIFDEYGFFNGIAKMRPTVVQLTNKVIVPRP